MTDKTQQSRPLEPDTEGQIIQAEFVDYSRTLVMDACHVTDPEFTPEGFRLFAFLHTLGPSFQLNRKNMIKFMGSEYKLKQAMKNIKDLGFLITYAKRVKGGTFKGHKWLIYKTKDKGRAQRFKAELELSRMAKAEKAKTDQPAKPLNQQPAPAVLNDSTECRNTTHGESHSISESDRVAIYRQSVIHPALQRSTSYKDLLSLSNLSLSEQSDELEHNPVEERDFKDFSKASTARPDPVQPEPPAQVPADPAQVKQALNNLMGSKGFDSPEASTPRMRAEANARTNESEIEKKRRLMQEQYEAMQRGEAPPQPATVNTDRGECPPSSAAPPRVSLKDLSPAERIAYMQTVAAQRAEEAKELAKTKEFQERDAAARRESVHPLAMPATPASAPAVDMEQYAELSPVDLVERLYSECINNPSPLKDSRNIKRFKAWFEAHAGECKRQVIEAFQQAHTLGAYSIRAVEVNLQKMGVQYAG